MSKKDARSYMSEFIVNQPLMQISVSFQNEIWIATVWFASDSDLNIYFISKDFRVHSKYIDGNPVVACAISGQFSEGPGQKVQGVQLCGIASKVSGVKVFKAYKTYAKKWPQLLKIGAVEAFKSDTAGIQMYKIKPTKLVWFDEQNYPNDPRIEIDLLA